MPKVTFLPNSELCPNGITVTAKEVTQFVELH